MTSTSAHNLRRVRKFPTSSGLANTHNETSAAPPTPSSSTDTAIHQPLHSTTTANATDPTTTNYCSAPTNARLSANAPRVQKYLSSTMHPSHHQLRSRSHTQSQSQLLPHMDVQKSTSTSTAIPSRLLARRAASTAQLSHHAPPTTIEGLISKPPASLTEALQDLRYLILTQGVQADTDGNVSCFYHTPISILSITNIVENSQCCACTSGRFSSVWRQCELVTMLRSSAEGRRAVTPRSVTTRSGRLQPTPCSDDVLAKPR
jgi:hypothetical protein